MGRPSPLYPHTTNSHNSHKMDKTIETPGLPIEILIAAIRIELGYDPTIKPGPGQMRQVRAVLAELRKELKC